MPLRACSDVPVSYPRFVVGSHNRQRRSSGSLLVAVEVHRERHEDEAPACGPSAGLRRRFRFVRAGESGGRLVWLIARRALAAADPACRGGDLPDREGGLELRRHREPSRPPCSSRSRSTSRAPSVVAEGRRRRRQRRDRDLPVPGREAAGEVAVVNGCFAARATSDVTKEIHSSTNGQAGRRQS
jgi:hypothetical protein